MAALCVKLHFCPNLQLSAKKTRFYLAKVSLKESEVVLRDYQYGPLGFNVYKEVDRWTSTF